MQAQSLEAIGSKRGKLQTVRPQEWFGRQPLPVRSCKLLWKASTGFTLIELLVVMVIIGLLGALVGPRLFKNVAKSKITATKAQIANFQTALGAYKLDVGVFPSTDEGLEALRVRPSNARNWDGPYLPKEIPPDPWGYPYVYKFPGEHGEEPDIISLGADGREGGEGENADIYSWK